MPRRSGETPPPNGNPETEPRDTPSHVLVPVPRELESQVRSYVEQLQAERRELSGWDEQSLVELFRGSDEMTRSLLSHLARQEQVGGVPRTQVARALELKGYVGEVLRSLKRRSEEEYGRVAPVTSEETTKGNRRIPVLKMTEEVAELVRCAEHTVHHDELRRKLP